MQERVSVNLQTAAIKIIGSIECCPYKAWKDMFPPESARSHWQNLRMKKQYKNATIRLIEMIEFAFFPLFVSKWNPGERQITKFEIFADILQHVMFSEVQ